MVKLSIMIAESLSDRAQHWLYHNWLHNAGITRQEVQINKISGTVPVLLLGPAMVKQYLGLKGISNWHGHITLKDGRLYGCTFEVRSIIAKPSLLPIVIRETSHLLEAASNPSQILERPNVHKYIPKFADARVPRVLDLEWDVASRRLTVLGMAESSREAYSTFSVEKATEIVKKQQCLIGHNLIDADLPKLNLTPASWSEKHVFDTKLAAHIIHPHLAELGMYGLGDLVRYYFPTQDWKNDKADLLTYNGYDCAYNYKLYEALRADLESTGQLHLLEKQQRLAEMTRLMHLKGVRVNVKAIQEFNSNWKANREKLKANFPFNPNSPKQVIGWANSVGIRLGNTRFETIERYAKMDSVLAQLRDYKDEGKPISTWYDKAAQECGYIYPQFNVTGTEVARFSCSGPNVQNIPPYLRHIIIPRSDDLELVSWDYSSIENYCCAIQANDTLTLSALHGKLDPYTLTATLIYNKRYEDVTSEERKAAKVTELASLYGETPHNLARRMYGNTKRDSVTKAKQLQDAYFAAHPPIREWQQRISKQLDTGDILLRNPFHRVRPIYAQDSHERKKRGCHFLGCSTAADIVNQRALDIWSETGLLPLLVVHDELCYELPKGNSSDKVKRTIEGILGNGIVQLQNARIPFKRKQGANYGFSDIRTNAVC